MLLTNKRLFIYLFIYSNQKLELSIIWVIPTAYLWIIYRMQTVSQFIGKKDN